MEKKKRVKPTYTAEEQAELHSTWDKYAATMRAEMVSGEMEMEQAVLLGLTIDMTADSAKTPYLNKAMLELACEVVSYLNDHVSKKDLPAEIQAEQAKHAQHAIDDYKKRIAALEDATNPERIEAAKKAAEQAEAEKVHIHAEAGGAFANVSLSDILNAPKAEGLPDR